MAGVRRLAGIRLLAPAAGTAALAAVVLTVGTAVPPVVLTAGTSGPTTYYVDCGHGSDASSGTSTGTAWNSLAPVDGITFGPGDQVLFARGSRCVGVLSPHGSGSVGDPVVAGAYGTGPLPQLAGEGARATVLLDGVEGWTLKDLDISDEGPPPAPGVLRTAVEVDESGTGSGYTIEDDVIHDVNSSPVVPTPGITLPKSLGLPAIEGEPGALQNSLSNWEGNAEDFENYAKVSGGIVFGATGGSFSHVLIQNNTLQGVDREGMYLQNIYLQDGEPGTGLVVQSNTLDDVGGDGIVAVGSTGAVIQRNALRGFNEEGTSFNAGIWAYDSSEAVLQFNSVSFGQHGPEDTMAYDIDGGDINVTFQYNLSFDNTGGFVMLCNNTALGFGSGIPGLPPYVGAPNGGSVVRYNISQDDSAVVRGVIDAPFACSTENNIKIYNNTIFTTDPRVTTMMENTNDSSAELTNNIIVGPGPQAQIYDTAASWSHNLYDGVSCVLRSGSDPSPVVASPGLVDPGAATSIDDAKGYELLSGSPALGTGAVVPDNGGRDFFGNAVPADTPPNIGAYQGPGVTGGLLASLGMQAPGVAPGCSTS